MNYCDSTSQYDCGTNRNTVWQPLDLKAFKLACLLHGVNLHD